MKPRTVLVTLTLITDIKLSLLIKKTEWQRFLDYYAFSEMVEVEKVKAVAIKESK